MIPATRFRAGRRSVPSGEDAEFIGSRGGVRDIGDTARASGWGLLLIVAPTTFASSGRCSRHPAGHRSAPTISGGISSYGKATIGYRIAV